MPLRMSPSDPHPPLRTFGRVKSRTIKAAQGVLLETLLPQIAGPLDVAMTRDGLRAGRDELWLEIGFGGGEHLAGQASRHPQATLIGAEPFLNGAASALRHIAEAGLTNVRLHVGDARDILDRLPDASLDRVFILFPDPWPKARHHKRRLIQQAFVADLVRVLVPGGRLRFATDWADYADWALQRMIAHPELTWTADRADDWRVPPADHVTTRYQEKGLGDIAPVYLDLIKR